MTDPRWTHTYRRSRLAYLQHHTTCHYCGAPATTIDHATPINAGCDPNDQSNWVAACAWCNSSKRDRKAPGIRRSLKRGPTGARGGTGVFAPLGVVGRHVGGWFGISGG